jgi:hypothetical protein
MNNNKVILLAAFIMLAGLSLAIGVKGYIGLTLGVGSFVVSLLVSLSLKVK